MEKQQSSPFDFIRQHPKSILTTGIILLSLWAFSSIVYGSEDRPAAEQSIVQLDDAAPNIKSIMADQESAWNNGDLDAFMGGYWKSDSLCFIGSKGLTYGWQQTLDNYKTGYPDKASMGILEFDIKKIEQTGAHTAFVIGAWHLARPEKGDAGGHFTLFWKKIDGQWCIVTDHSS